MANPHPYPSENTPIATMVSLPPPDAALPVASATPPPLPRRRTYRGGFTTSLCALFRDPRRRTDCCAVACCGVLASDRTRYLLTGERPPPLWLRTVVCVLVPTLFVTAMGYFAAEVPVPADDGAGAGEGAGAEGGTVKVVPPELVVAFVAYVGVCFAYNCVRGRSTRREIMQRLYEERAGGADQVTPAQVQAFLRGHQLEITRAHSCCSCLYPVDGPRDGTDAAAPPEEAAPPEDFCTRLWDGLSGVFWGCGGCWCQCCGLCAVAQEEREVDRLVPGRALDYLTFQPHADYHPKLQQLNERRERSPWKHLGALSELSRKLLQNVAAVLAVLLLLALVQVDANFTLENMAVLLLTLGQAFLIEYFVHWKWNLFDLSFDSVVKYFACGFFLSTPSAIVFEIVVSTVASIVTFVFGLIVVSTDSNLLDQFDDDPKQAAKEVVLHYPAIFVLYNFLNAFVVAALVEEMVKHFGYRMVVTPDLLPGDAAPGADGAGAGPDGAGAGPDGRSAAKGLASTGAGVTVAMVSTALGFACCENLMYVFVYSPPSLGVEISTLLARSLFPVHPLCAAIQSIGVCARDLEGNDRIGLGRIIFPAVLLHGAFDFVLMLAAYFQQVEHIKEGTDDGLGGAGGNGDADDTTEDLVAQLPSMVAGAVFIIIGCAYYAIQSRAQTLRLVAMDSAARELNSPLV